MKVSTRDRMLNFEFDVGPQSPLARGISIQATMACQIDTVRSIMTSTRAKIRASYSRPDHTPLGIAILDLTVCRR